MKENIIITQLRSYVIAELNDSSIAEAFVSWVTLNFKNAHISFYNAPSESSRKNRIQPVSFYLVIKEGKVKKVNKRVYPDRSIELKVPHISICKSSVSSRVDFFTSQNLDSKLGQGTSNIASLDQGQLKISFSRQTWIS